MSTISFVQLFQEAQRFFARAHDNDIWQCTCDSWQIDPAQAETVKNLASLLLVFKLSCDPRVDLEQDLLCALALRVVSRGSNHGSSFCAASIPSPCVFLPVWPSTRRVWPPPCSLRKGWGLGKEEVRSGDRGCSHLLGSRWQSDDKCHGSRAQRCRYPQVGGRC